MIKNVAYLFLLLACIVHVSCSRCSGDKDGNLNVPDSVKNMGVTDVSESAVQDMIENISSPIEIAAIIKGIGVPFSKEYLATTSYTANYNTSYAQAFALGIFSADMGYLNMYNKTGPILDYITTIKTLADEIKIGQFFDFSTLKRLATNNSNIDSLMYISVHSFNEMDRYLRQNNRGNLSALIVAGVWLEGLYLATQVQKVKPDPKLSEKIGEQKVIMTDMMVLLRTYGTDPVFLKYLEEFESIKKLYNEVTITYELGDPETVEQNGMLTIIQRDKQVVNISDEQLNLITKTIESVRNKLIKM